MSIRKQLPLYFSMAVLCFVVTSAFLAGCDRGNATNDGANSNARLEDDSTATTERNNEKTVTTASTSRTRKDGGSKKKPVTDTESEDTAGEQTLIQKRSGKAVASKPKLSAEAQRLRRVLKDGGVGTHWFYDDLDGAMAEAKATGKSLFVAFR